MDTHNKSWAEKARITLICCTYLAVTVMLVSVFSQPLHSPSNLPPEQTVAAENVDAVDGSLKFNEYDIEATAVRGKKAEAVFHPIISEAASEHEIDPDFIKAIIWAESSFNPKAVSNKGAQGLMQLMPSTARSLGVEDCMNPESNINAGVRYFKQLMIQFGGDKKLALAAYNAGSRRVREYNGIPPFETTQFYVKKVFEYYQEFKGEEPQKINNI